MKILILGSDGFIGYHLSDSILKDDRFSDVKIIGKNSKIKSIPLMSSDEFMKTLWNKKLGKR